MQARASFCFSASPVSDEVPSLNTIVDSSAPDDNERARQHPRDGARAIGVRPRRDRKVTVHELRMR